MKYVIIFLLITIIICCLVKFVRTNFSAYFHKKDLKRNHKKMRKNLEKAERYRQRKWYGNN